MKKCMKIVFCFLVHGRLFFMFFQTFSDCDCKCICCLNDSSYLFPCLRMYLQFIDQRSVYWSILTAYSVRSYSTRGNIAHQLINIDRCRSPCSFNLMEYQIMYHQINQSKNYKSSQLNLTIYIGFFFLKRTKDYFLVKF